MGSLCTLLLNVDVTPNAAPTTHEEVACRRFSPSQTCCCRRRRLFSCPPVQRCVVFPYSLIRKKITLSSSGRTESIILQDLIKYSVARNFFGRLALNSKNLVAELLSDDRTTGSLYPLMNWVYNFFSDQPLTAAAPSAGFQHEELYDIWLFQLNDLHLLINDTCS